MLFGTLPADSIQLHDAQAVASYIRFLLPNWLLWSNDSVLQVAETLSLSSAHIGAVLCILDSLSHRFYRTWLLMLPDSWHVSDPAIIVFAAASLTDKYFEDNAPSRTFYLKLLDSFGAATSPELFSKVEWEVFADLDYNIARLQGANCLEYLDTCFKGHRRSETRVEKDANVTLVSNMSALWSNDIELLPMMLDTFSL